MEVVLCQFKQQDMWKKEQLLRRGIRTDSAVGNGKRSVWADGISGLMEGRSQEVTEIQKGCWSGALGY